MQAIEQSPFRRYSAMGLRSLIGMVPRRALHRVNGSASLILVKPFVVLAARVLGPGPTRLRLVKLAHNLSNNGNLVELTKGGYDADEGPAVQPTTRAA